MGGGDSSPPQHDPHLVVFFMTSPRCNRVANSNTVKSFELPQTLCLFPAKMANFKTREIQIL